MFESPTNNIFLAIRIIEPDPKKGQALKAAFRIYPYADRAKAKKGVYTPPPGKYFFGPPRGMAFWERLHEILNREVVAERDRFFMAMLKRVGIEKGKPFNPTPRQKKLLEEAAFVGEAMAKANDLAKRSTEPYWKGANWKIALGLDPTQRMENYDQLDERAEWMYEAVTTSAGMVTTTPGLGSIYLASYADKDGDWLEGGKSYTLHIPANPPAEQFWSVAVYSWDTRTLIDNEQKRAAQSSRQDLIKNAGWLDRPLLRPDGTEGQREELGPDHSRTRLVGLPALLRPDQGVLRQELEHGRLRETQVDLARRTRQQVKILPPPLAPFGVAGEGSAQPERGSWRRHGLRR